MNKHKLKASAGFTLIEVVVYLALFAIIIGGGVATAYMVFESSGRSQTKAMLQNEGDFLLGKIEWVLSGIQRVDVASHSILQVTRYDNSSLTINLSGSEMQLQNTPLNNSSVQVSGLEFERITGSGEGVNPESVEAKFTLTAKTPGGADISQTFSTIKYLRR